MFLKLVTVTFWSIYHIDRDLIWPVQDSLVIPDFQNHITHTVPLIGVLFDNILFRKTYNQSLIKGFLPTFIAG